MRKVYLLLIGLIFLASCNNADSGIRGNDNDNNTVILGDNNTVTSENIYSKSMEEQLQIIYSNDGKLTKNNLKTFLKKSSAETWRKTDDLSTYIIMYKNTNDISPWPRMILIFHKNDLLGVFHDKPLDLNSESFRLGNTRLQVTTLGYLDNKPDYIQEQFQYLVNVANNAD